MNDVPEDIKKAASSIAKGVSPHDIKSGVLAKHIERALLAERERATAVARGRWRASRAAATTMDVILKEQAERDRFPRTRHKEPAHE